MASITIQHMIAGRPGHGPRRRRAIRARPVRPSKSTELWYKRNLRALVERLQATTNSQLMPMLRQAARAQNAAVGDASFEDEVNAVIDRMAQQLGGLDALAQRLAGEAVQKSLKSVDEGLTKSIKSSIGIDVSGALTTDEKLAAKIKAANQANVELITSIPAEYFDKIREAVEDNTQQGTRYESLVERVQEIGDVTESRADLIARDQTSKMNSAFNEARQTSLGIEEYIWQGAGDERERETHMANNGQRFRWDDPPAETGNPGEDINCRCVAVPYFDV